MSKLRDKFGVNLGSKWSVELALADWPGITGALENVSSVMLSLAD